MNALPNDLKQPPLACRSARNRLPVGSIPGQRTNELRRNFLKFSAVYTPGAQQSRVASGWSWAVLAALLVISGCGPAKSSPSPATENSTVPLVMVTSEPLYQMARMIADQATADGRVRIERTTSAARFSSTWSPGSATVRRMQQARCLILNGAGYEPWTERVVLPRSRIVDTAAVYAEQLVTIPDAVQHQHGPDGHHSHPGLVWATWLDPALLSLQATQVHTALARVLPEQEPRLSKQTAELLADLERLDARVAELAQQTADRKVRVLADGPFYQYLTQRLSWQLTYLHWPARSDPLPEHSLTEFRRATEDGAFDLFLMLDSRDDGVRKLVETAGLSCVAIDLCEQIRDDSVSLQERLNGNLERLLQAIESLP